MALTATAAALSAMRSRAMLLLTGLALVVLMLASSAAHADTYRIEIINLKSKLRADVMWASQAAFQGVFLWPNNTSASQEFDLLDSGGGHFRIRARHSGQCLMLDWNQIGGNGRRIVQYPCYAGWAGMEWRRGWVQDPVTCNGDLCSTSRPVYPVLVNRLSGRCLDARNGAGGAPPAQAVLQQWDCIRTARDWNAGNQLFVFSNEGYL